MTILASYLDVSGNMPDQRICTVAGFVATSEQWDAFAAQWEDALLPFGLDFFHATDFASRQKQYKGWPESKRQDMMNALLTVIEHHTLASTAYGVSWDMYQNEVPLNVQKLIGKAPYYFLFFNLVTGVQEMFDAPARLAAGVPLDWEVKYFLASGDKGSSQILKAWMSKQAGTALARKEARLVSVEVELQTRLAPLQAADLLAFEVRRQLRLLLSGEDRPARYPFTRLEKLRFHSWGFYQHPWHLRANADVIERRVLGKSNEELLTW